MTWAEMVQGTAKAVKHEHEWVDAKIGGRFVTRWSQEFDGWETVSKPGGYSDWFFYGNGPEAAEIARLAGLTVPEKGEGA